MASSLLLENVFFLRVQKSCIHIYISLPSLVVVAVTRWIDRTRKHKSTEWKINNDEKSWSIPFGVIDYEKSLLISILEENTTEIGDVFL